MTSETAPIADSDKDNPQAREQWFRKGRTAPPGQSAAELRYRAHQQKMRMRAARAQTAAAQLALTPNAPVTGWTALGPAPLASDPGTGQDYNWVSGRATSVVIDPADTTGNTVYVGGAFGGLWRSTNAAAASASSVQWTPMIDNQPTLAVGAIALQPNNATNNLSNVILVGTGEANSSGDSYYGLGILRSTNAGSTWSLISTANAGAYSFKGLSFSKIAFSSAATNVAVAGVASTFPGEQEGADNLTAPRGVYYSTDSGVNWTYASVQDGMGATVVSASASSVIYNAVSRKFYAAIRRHGFYSSSDGITWTRLSLQPGSAGLLSTSNCPNSVNSSTCPIYRGEFAVVPGRNEMYVWFMDATFTGEVDQGIWQSKDGGNSWTSISTTGIDSCGDPGAFGCGVQQGEYNLELAAVPNGNTATDLYAGAINIFKCAINNTNNPACSNNPFMNLTHVYGCLQIAHVHPDQHGVDSVVAGGKDILYFANDGGIYRALDGFTGLTTGTCGGTNNFDSLNQTIGSITEFVSFSQDPGNLGTLLGGTQDNGSPATSQAMTSTGWINVNGGDGGYNEINPNNPTEWFTANTDVTIQRCTSGISCTGNTFNLVVSAPQVGGDVGPFYTPYILDPQATSEMLVGTCRLWRGTSQGANFLAFSFNFDTGTTATCNGGEINQARSLATGGPKDTNGISSVIYVGTDGTGPVLLSPPQGGRVFVATNANGGPALWQDTTGNINGFGYPVSSIAIDSSDSTGSTAYVTIMGFSGFPGVSHVFKTTNAGQSWADFSAGLPDAPANSIVVDAGPTPENGTVYVGTDVGVFSSPTLSASWTEVGPTPSSGPGFIPNVPVTKLRIFNSGGQKLLRASTYGRGVWQFPLSVTPDFAMAADKLQLSAFPNQTATFNGNLYALFGYNNAVTLSCGTGAPPTCNVPSGVIPSPGGTPFAISASGPAVFDYSFNIHGVGSDSTTHDLPVAFHVLDFSIYSVQPTNVIANQGSESQPSSISLLAVGQFSGVVTLSCDPNTVPPGATCYFSPSSLSPGSTLSASNFTLGTTSATPVASYPITILVNSAGAPSAKTTTVTVTVQSGKDYNVVVGAVGGTIPGGSSSFPITLTSVNGYSGTVNLACNTYPDLTLFTCSVNPSLILLGTGQSGSASGSLQANIGIQVRTYTVRVFASDSTAGLSHEIDTDFSVNDFQFVPTNGVATVTAGQAANYTLKITPLGPGGFTNSISLACAGLPAQATCSFSPTSVTPGANATTITLNISTTTRAASLHRSKEFYALSLPFAGLLLVFGGVFADRWRRSKTWLAAAFLMAFGVSLLLVACGGGGGNGNTPPPPPPPPSGTPAGSYTITVNATSGLLAHSTSVSLTVQ
ncbi:MAG TPA: hypothetical protein VEV41_11665 [Terriglobales bacterium]|nr:hypothetical protein [Terriglobales bacterium]